MHQKSSEVITFYSKCFYHIFIHAVVLQTPLALVYHYKLSVITDSRMP